MSVMLKVTRLFGTPWCSDCKISKTFLADQRISYNYVDITEDEEAALLVEKINNGKRKIPTIEFSDGTYLVEPSNAELASKLGLIIKPLKNSYDVLIIGSGPAGLTCGIYTAREGYEVVIVEKGAVGGRMNFTERIENYPGFPEGIEGVDLARKFTAQAERFGVEILKATKVFAIEKIDRGFSVTTSQDDIIKVKTILVATGSDYKTLNVKGEADLLGYKIHYCAVCDGPFYTGKKVLVIGGGNSALEESLFLARFASEVMITEILDNLTASKVIQEQVAAKSKIKIFTSYEIREFLVGEKKELNGVRFYDRKNNKEIILYPDGVFMLVGLKPNTKIVEKLVELSETRAIKTDDRMMTSVPGIFAAGDCRCKSTQQVGSAVGEGVIAALRISDYIKNL